MNQKFKNLVLAILDMVILCLAGYLTLLVRYPLNLDAELLLKYSEALIYLLPIWLLFFYIEGFYSYKNKKTWEMLISIIRAVTINSVLSIVYFYIFPQFNITPKTNIAIYAVFSIGLLFGFRYMFFKLVSLNAFVVNTALVGPKELCLGIETFINENPLLGYQVVERAHNLEDCPENIGKFDFDQIDLVAIDSRYLNNPVVMKLLYKNLSKDIRILNLVDYVEKVSGEVAVEDLEESWVLRNFAIRSNKRYFRLKNFFDKVVALLIMVFAFPVFFLSLVLAALMHGRPLFFKQKRTGYLDRKFDLYKLRTMVVDAEKNGHMWATPGDCRVTAFGRFLRKSRIDELPQLWNVIKGDMSLVGPRPERPEIISSLEKKLPFYNARHLVKPGITGWAQVNFGYGCSDSDSLKKLKFDLYYTKHKSLWLDLRIALKTIKTILTGVGH